MFQQNQLITLQQQALQQQALQQAQIQQAQQIIDPKLQIAANMVTNNQFNQQAHYNLPNARMSNLAPGIITPMVQFNPQLNSQIMPQVNHQFTPQMQFDMSQQMNSMNHIPIIPQQLQFSQTPQVTTNFQPGLIPQQFIQNQQFIPQQQQQFIPQQQLISNQQLLPNPQMILPAGIYSQTSLNTSFQSNQAGKNNGAQQTPQMFLHAPQQFGPQYQNVVGPNFYNYYGS